MVKRHVLEKKLAHFDLETQLWQQDYQLVAGVDEAGRGALAGPVVVAAVIFSPNTQIEEVEDSKKLKPADREKLFTVICQTAMHYDIVVIAHQEVDRINVLQATLKGMKQSIENIKPDYVLVDGNRYPNCEVKGHAVIKGDSISKSIAAASILAKVSRDRIMQEFSKQYPKWDFAKHKGYPTQQHRQLIAEFGISPIHRKTFRVSHPKMQSSFY